MTIPEHGLAAAHGSFSSRCSSIGHRSKFLCNGYSPINHHIYSCFSSYYRNFIDFHMADAVPPQLKPIGRHLQVAKQVDKVQPVIAYYCTFSRRLFALLIVVKVCILCEKSLGSGMTLGRPRPPSLVESFQVISLSIRPHNFLLSTKESENIGILGLLNYLTDSLYSLGLIRIASSATVSSSLLPSRRPLCSYCHVYR